MALKDRKAGMTKPTRLETGAAMEFTRCRNTRRATPPMTM